MSKVLSSGSEPKTLDGKPITDGMTVYSTSGQKLRVESVKGNGGDVFTIMVRRGKKYKPFPVGPDELYWKKPN